MAKMEAAIHGLVLSERSLKLNRKLLRNSGSKATEPIAADCSGVLLSPYTGSNHDV